MTDAPNSVSEFGWRKPHPRCTPPWAGLFPFFCRGRAPSRPVALPFTPISVGSRIPFGPRRGGPMCPPVDGSCEEPCPGRHIGRPLQNIPHWKTGQGQSPAPTGRSWCQAAGRRSRTPAPAKAAQPDRSARDLRPAVPRRAHSQLSILNFPQSQAPARGLVLGRRFLTYCPWRWAPGK